MDYKKYALTIFLSTILYSLFSQDGVGIGTNDPHPSSVLHVQSSTNNKGILFPNSTNALINSIPSPIMDGLFIYDETYHRYGSYKNGTWIYANPWDTEAIQPDRDINYITTPYRVGIGLAGAPTVALEVNGDLRADRLEGFGIVPLGGIIMWSGAEGDIPSNFQLCDGTTRNGRTTPNLVGRFIRGARNGGGAGGSDNIATSRISYVETPQYTINGSNCQVYQYQYTFDYDVECPDFIPPEVFTLTATFAANSCAEAQSRVSFEGCIITGYSACTQTPNPNYYLTNPDCFNSSVDIVDAATGTDNRPAYYELAFIMRVE